MNALYYGRVATKEQLKEDNTTERIIFFDNKIFDYSEAAKGGYYELCNKCDELCDIFEELTEEEKKQGLFYGDWLIILQ